jgi:hypothetical protein
MIAVLPIPALAWGWWWQSHLAQWLTPALRLRGLSVYVAH